MELLAPGQSYKYLGIWINSQLKWTCHFEYTMEKTRAKLLKIARCPISTPKKITTTNSTIVPLWTYGASGHGLSKTHCAKAQKLLLGVVKYSAHVMKCASSSAICTPVELGGFGLLDIFAECSATRVAEEFFTLNTPSSIAYTTTSAYKHSSSQRRQRCIPSRTVAYPSVVRQWR